MRRRSAPNVASMLRSQPMQAMTKTPESRENLWVIDPPIFLLLDAENLHEGRCFCAIEDLLVLG